MTPEKRREKRRRYRKNKKMRVEEIMCRNPLPLDSCVPVVANTKAPCPTSHNEEEEDMFVEQEVTVTQRNTDDQRRKYFLNRTQEAFYTKLNNAEKHFGLVDDAPPHTANELVKRITEGKFTIPSDKGDKVGYVASAYIRWNDPAVKEDQPGMDAATKKLDKLLADTRDMIWAETDASKLPGLLQAFETATVH